MLLGCIADDFTGATDLANNLTRGGMRKVQTVGVPREKLRVDVDAVAAILRQITDGVPMDHHLAGREIASFYRR